MKGRLYGSYTVPCTGCPESLLTKGISVPPGKSALCSCRCEMLIERGGPAAVLSSLYAGGWLYVEWCLLKRGHNLGTKT